jgi:hypothetical protein
MDDDKSGDQSLPPQLVPHDAHCWCGDEADWRYCTTLNGSLDPHWLCVGCGSAYWLGKDPTP